MIWPKLVTIALDELKWDKVGIKIDENYLSRYKYADDIDLISSNLNGPQKMFTELNDGAQQIGLRMNYRKIISIDQDM